MGVGFPVDFSNVSLLLPGRSGKNVSSFSRRTSGKRLSRGDSEGRQHSAVEEGAAAVRVKELRG